MNVGIFLLDLVDGSKRQLTKPPEGTFNEWPLFSPDGTKVAFSRGLGGEPGSALGSIYVVNVDGTSLQQVTDPALNAIRPRWSPDGRLIAFSSNADNYMAESANVWVVAPEGTGLRQLTFQLGLSQGFFPDWSPDGRHLVFLRHRAGSGTQDLAIIGLDGGEQCTLWTGTGSRLAGDPDWGPTGG
jgi:TolB protein